MRDQRDLSSGSAGSQTPAIERPGRPSAVVLGSLAVVLLVTAGLHVWGLAGDLPYGPYVDESIFVNAAVHMLAHRTLDPAWFGNPGSTLIYPAAFLTEPWSQRAKLLPFTAHPSAGFAATFATDPTPFYMIGRLVSAGYDLGAVVATWLVGRRIFGDAGGILAALFFGVTALVVHYGQVVRTDSAGVFFALMTLWLILRATEGARRWDWALAAVAIGLAVSTRYFFVTLVVPYAMAVWLWYRSRRAQAHTDAPRAATAVSPIRSIWLAPLAFAATSPFFFIRFQHALADLHREARTVHPGFDGLSPLGNLAWYLTTMLPAAVGFIALGLAVVGIFLAARVRRAETAVLVAYAGSYLAGISASPLHWDRYVIPLVPVVGVFAGGALLTMAGALLGRLRTTSFEAGSPLRSPSAIAMASIAVVVLLIPSMQAVAAEDRLKAVPSTRVVATEWARANLADARVAEEAYCTYLGGTTDRFALLQLNSQPVEAYRAQGFDYLIVSTANYGRYYDDPGRYQPEVAFYDSLKATGRLVASFTANADRGGPRIDVYDIRLP